jgi:hypothetical protein
VQAGFIEQFQTDIPRLSKTFPAGISLRRFLGVMPAADGSWISVQDISNPFSG